MWTVLLIVGFWVAAPVTLVAIAFAVDWFRMCRIRAAKRKLIRNCEQVVRDVSRQAIEARTTILLPPVPELILGWSRVRELFDEVAAEHAATVAEASDLDAELTALTKGNK